ncbi:unnamed protein product [Prorocentrum cordatum]|uniref:Uncharacterized protein n=1 Tax=Prorocentrum cordatum TaxID=2364126 RepID=A0ABN9XQZ0_9DINO|nr:unnamed protein product [Polarella glacialis]
MQQISSQPPVPITPFRPTRAGPHRHHYRGYCWRQGATLEEQRLPADTAHRRSPQCLVGESSVQQGGLPLAQASQMHECCSATASTRRHQLLVTANALGGFHFIAGCL